MKRWEFDTIDRKNFPFSDNTKMKSFFKYININALLKATTSGTIVAARANVR